MTWTDESDFTNKDFWIGEYWIGLKTDSNGKWKWDHESGKPLRQNSDLGWWKTGEPKNNHGNDGCAAVEGGKEVVEANCDDERPVLCVKRKLFYQVSTEVELLPLKLRLRGW